MHCLLFRSVCHTTAPDLFPFLFKDIPGCLFTYLFNEEFEESRARTHMQYVNINRPFRDNCGTDVLGGQI